MVDVTGCNYMVLRNFWNWHGSCIAVHEGINQPAIFQYGEGGRDLYPTRRPLQRHGLWSWNGRLIHKDRRMLRAGY